MPKSKFGSLESHKLTRENQISDMMLRGNKFVKRHDLTPSIRLYMTLLIYSDFEKLNTRYCCLFDIRHTMV